MKDFVKFIVVLLILALSVGLVYSMLSPILGEFFPEETKDKNVSTETKELSETKTPSTTTTEPLETDVVDPEETEPSHVHDYGDYVVVTKATCSTKGLEKATCKGCAGYLTREIAKLAHTYDNGEITTEPTCAKAGVKTYTCSLCGNKKTETISKLTTHTYDSGKITIEPTCAETGVKTYTCSVCGNKKTETVSKLTTHNYVNGKCSYCGTANECAHDWEYAGGRTASTCNVCGATCTHPNPTYSDFYYVDSEYHDFDIICPLCGCSDTGSNVNGFNYPHDFVDGECVCGATEED